METKRRRQTSAQKGNVVLNGHEIPKGSGKKREDGKSLSAFRMAANAFLPEKYEFKPQPTKLRYNRAVVALFTAAVVGTLTGNETTREKLPCVVGIMFNCDGEDSLLSGNTIDRFGSNSRNNNDSQDTSTSVTALPPNAAAATAEPAKAEASPGTTLAKGTEVGQTYDVEATGVNAGKIVRCIVRVDTFPKDLNGNKSDEQGFFGASYVTNDAVLGPNGPFPGDRAYALSLDLGDANANINGAAPRADHYEGIPTPGSNKYLSDCKPLQ